MRPIVCFAIAIFVAGLVIALSWAAVRRPDVEELVATKKPSDDDLNDFAPSRSMGRTREIVHETDREKLTDPHPIQDHIQYLEEPGIRLMLARADKQREEKARRSKSILWRIFENEKRSLDRDVDKRPQLEPDESREL